ncbi:MAG: hypothetical protein H6508_01745 [Calditrichaeota bacterium]|nr:hypothetical protein [Calditrichota bacterium]
MKSITNTDATILVQRLHNEGNLIWYFGAKVILVLPNNAVSVKNKVELIHALREHGYLRRNETLNDEVCKHFRMAAEATMLDAKDFFERFRGADAEADLKANKNNIAGIKEVLMHHVGDMVYEDYRTAVVTA